MNNFKRLLWQEREQQVVPKLSEFRVPEDSAETPRLTQGAFPSTGDERDPKAEKSSLAFTSFNYINSIVGSGVLGK